MHYMYLTVWYELRWRELISSSLVVNDLDDIEVAVLLWHWRNIYRIIIQKNLRNTIALLHFRSFMDETEY